MNTLQGIEWVARRYAQTTLQCEVAQGGSRDPADRARVMPGYPTILEWIVRPRPPGTSNTCFAPEVSQLLESEWSLGPLLDDAFSAHTIRDEQLRMMFSCCHPRLPEEAQVALHPQHPLRLRRRRDR